MLLEFSSFPAGQKSLSGAVAKIIDLIDKSGLPYQTHALGLWSRENGMILCNW